MSEPKPFVSRAGLKLEHALNQFKLVVTGFVCADFGCNAGGFTDCLLRRGATKVYAIDTGYGALDYNLRRDARVVVMERTNAMHVTLEEPIDLVVIDVAWTKQRLILPAAEKVLKPAGQIITLIKPHYEAPPELLRKGILPPERREEVVAQVADSIPALGFEVRGLTQSPITGSKGNAEWLAWLTRRRAAG